MWSMSRSGSESSCDHDVDNRHGPHGLGCGSGSGCDHDVDNRHGPHGLGCGRVSGCDQDVDNSHGPHGSGSYVVGKITNKEMNWSLTVQMYYFTVVNLCTYYH